MNGGALPPGIVAARGPYDAVGASGGPDLGSINPDSADRIIRALAAHLDQITELLKPDPSAPIEQVQFEVDAANIPGGGLTYHLPKASAVVGYYLENNSNNTISIYGGTSGASRALATVPAYTFKASPIPQQVMSVAIVSSGTSVGLIRLLISSANLGPAFGSLIGAATAPPAGTATTTTPLLTTTPQLVLAANPNRIGASLYNNGGTNSGGVGYGNATFVAPLPAYGTVTPPINWKGSIYAFTFSGTTPSVITEFTT